MAKSRFQTKLTEDLNLLVLSFLKTDEVITRISLLNHFFHSLTTAFKQQLQPAATSTEEIHTLLQNVMAAVPAAPCKFASVYPDSMVRDKLMALDAATMQKAAREIALQQIPVAIVLEAYPNQGNTLLDYFRQQPSGQNSGTLSMWNVQGVPFQRLAAPHLERRSSEENQPPSLTQSIGFHGLSLFKPSSLPELTPPSLVAKTPSRQPSLSSIPE